jgi:hypothetical protein
MSIPYIFNLFSGQGMGALSTSYHLLYLLANDRMFQLVLLGCRINTLILRRSNH